jgi:hypothetical protein
MAMLNNQRVYHIISPQMGSLWKFHRQHDDIPMYFSGSPPPFSLTYTNAYHIRLIWLNNFLIRSEQVLSWAFLTLPQASS